MKCKNENDSLIEILKIDLKKSGISSDFINDYLSILESQKDEIERLNNLIKEKQNCICNLHYRLCVSTRDNIILNKRIKEAINVLMLFKGKCSKEIINILKEG